MGEVEIGGGGRSEELEMEEDQLVSLFGSHFAIFLGSFFWAPVMSAASTSIASLEWDAVLLPLWTGAGSDGGQLLTFELLYAPISIGSEPLSTVQKLHAGSISLILRSSF